MRSFFAVALAALASTVFAAEVPRPSPEYALSFPGGKQDLLSHHRGKVVVVEFLFTTCPHCQKSATLLSKFQKEYGPKGLEVIGVAINENPDIAGFTRQYATAFPVAASNRDSAFVYLQQSIMSTNFYVPQMVFVDRKGVIRGQYSGTDPFLGEQQEANIRNMIDKLVAEKPVSAKPAKPKGVS